MKGKGKKSKGRRATVLTVAVALTGTPLSVFAEHDFDTVLSCPSTATLSSSIRAGLELELASVEVQSRAPSQPRKREILLGSGKIGMKPSLSGISEHRRLHINFSSIANTKTKKNHTSLFTVASSAIQIEYFSSDDDEDCPQSGVSARYWPYLPSSENLHSTDKGHSSFYLGIETDLHRYTVQSTSHRRHACLFGHIHPRATFGHYYTRLFNTSTVPSLPGEARNRPALPILEVLLRAHHRPRRHPTRDGQGGTHCDLRDSPTS